ncbi:MAG: molybdopterin-dependent oxidoreductase [Longimicrobiales bacterium]
MLGWAYRRLAIGAGAAEPIEPDIERVDRRKFMIRLGGATALITVAGADLGRLLAGARAGVAPAMDRWSAMNPLPNAGARVQPVEGTRPELKPLEDHYRIDINTSPPVVDGDRWRLQISGLVERPVELSVADLRDRFEPTHQFITLACISNRIAGDLIGTTRWTGVSLGRLLEDVGLRPEATHLHIRSVDGFDEVVALELVRADPRVMLTYAWDGVPLAEAHGFPLRIYIPDRYGMKQPKWIESIEAVDQWEPGYWVRRGWDRDALMRATSVIDTIAVDMMIIEADSQSMTVPIGGIAHAAARGISRVELRVDDGPWQPALLREPLSDTTWVIWRYDWPFQAGEHTFTVRCFDGDGAPQIETPSPVRPSGVTGLHSLTEMF